MPRTEGHIVIKKKKILTDRMRDKRFVKPVLMALATMLNRKGFEPQHLVVHVPLGWEVSQ